MSDLERTSHVKPVSCTTMNDLERTLHTWNLRVNTINCASKTNKTSCILLWFPWRNTSHKSPCNLSQWLWEKHNYLSQTMPKYLMSCFELKHPVPLLQHTPCQCPQFPVTSISGSMESQWQMVFGHNIWSLKLLPLLCEVGFNTHAGNIISETWEKSKWEN